MVVFGSLQSYISSFHTPNLCPLPINSGHGFLGEKALTLSALADVANVLF